MGQARARPSRGPPPCAAPAGAGKLGRVEAPPVTHEQVLERALAVFRTRQAALAWYTLPNARLGASPRSLVERGEAERVLAELRELPAPERRVFGFLADGLWGRRG
jgi:hypothetical protein